MEVLSQGQVKVACVPPHVQSAIKSCSHFNLQYITPTLVSSTFRSIQVRSTRALVLGVKGSFIHQANAKAQVILFTPSDCKYQRKIKMPISTNRNGKYLH